MMTFEQFDAFITAIDTYYERSALFSKAMEPFNDSWTVTNFCELLPVTVFKYMKEDFKDEGEWIDWWYWEHRHNPSLKATTKEGTEIKIDTTKDLYDLLISNLN